MRAHAREMHPQSSRKGIKAAIPQKRRLATAWVRIRPLSEMGFAAAGISRWSIYAVARVETGAAFNGVSCTVGPT